MSDQKRICGLSVALLLALYRPAQAVVVFATDFNLVPTGSAYADNTVLSTDAVATTDDVKLRTSTANSNFSVVDLGSGNHALQLLDNDAASNTFPKANSNTFTPLSTTGTGNNWLTGSFSYTRLLSQTSSTTSPSFTFTASGNAGGFVLQLSVENNGHLFYYNGTTNTDSGFTLTTGTEYTFQIDADLSNSTQDTWSLKLIPVGTQTPAVTLSNLKTQVANGAIFQFSFWGGLNGPAVNSSYFGQVDNISFSAVPEPAAAGLIFAATGGLLARRKR
jgi:hypothetical protein